MTVVWVEGPNSRSLLLLLIPLMESFLPPGRISGAGGGAGARVRSVGSTDAEPLFDPQSCKVSLWPVLLKHWWVQCFPTDKNTSQLAVCCQQLVYSTWLAFFLSLIFFMDLIWLQWEAEISCSALAAEPALMAHIGWAPSTQWTVRLTLRFEWGGGFPC